MMQNAAQAGAAARTRPVDVVRSVAFYVAFYLGSVWFVMAALLASKFSNAFFMRAVRRWSTYHRSCARVLLGIHVEVEGDIPEGGVLVAMKHESFFEAIDMPAMMKSPVPLPKAELLKIPGWGRAARAYGVVAVEREGGAKALRAMVTAGRGFAEQGRPLVIFPEGTRVPSGQMPDLKSGFAGLYKLLGLPVVPVAVDSGGLYHRRWKKSGTMTYRVGAMIQPGLPRGEVEAQVRAAINALNTAP